MPPRKMFPGRNGLVRWFFLGAFAGGVAPLAAQELRLQRDYPGSDPFECLPVRAYAEPSGEERAQARQLSSDADNAVILGDYARAEEMLAQASELDPTSAEVAYSRARILETLARVEDSMAEYCRASSLGAASLGILDSEARLRALDDALRSSISPTARQHFANGVRDADAGFYAEAVTAFTGALDELPDWPEAVYNRGIVFEQMGLFEESLADYRTYLALRPDAVDPLVAFVSERIGTLESLGAIPTPSPGNTLAFGVLFPGMGQYYSGRTSTGAIVLGAVLGAVTTGLIVKKVTIRCLQPVAPGADCPPGEVVDEMAERPYLIPAIVVGAAVTVGGAVEAWLRARRRRVEQEAELGAEQQGFSVAGPSVRSNGDRLDLSFLSLRFR